MKPQIQVRPVSGSNASVLAHFSFEVPLGDNMRLVCANGSILRSRNGEVVVYPRVVRGDGRQAATWFFTGESQREFDGAVLQEWRKCVEREKSARFEKEDQK